MISQSFFFEWFCVCVAKHNRSMMVSVGKGKPIDCVPNNHQTNQTNQWKKDGHLNLVQKGKGREREIRFVSSIMSVRIIVSTDDVMVVEAK